ncbi:MAG TPA: ThuA domain-containing protein [bacterium]|nr:ThuA domain-containing protein [bacterium]HPN45258.1 ThuA domain-containing protein [bacterium]
MQTGTCSFGKIVFISMFVFWVSAFAQFPRFKALAFYSNHVEPAHVEFAHDAIRYFQDLTIGDGFVFDTTSSMADLNAEKLKDYSIILMLNDFPHSAEQRAAFEQYMQQGGGWLGFHVAAYNDRDTHWPWLLEFLGGGVFYRNNWPPMPAKLVVDVPDHPVTKGLPQAFISPENEWYQWQPSPRDNQDIQVLVTLSPDNYPLGLKDIVPDGDLPVVWTNTKYRMLYMNMGHGHRIFADPAQNQLIIAGLRWVVACDKKGNVFER